MDTFSALADPTRRHIIEMLAQNGQLSATTISKKFHMSAPAISQHLKILKEAKLVDMEKRAQQRIYSLNSKTVSNVEQWARGMKQLWKKRFDALEKVLEIEKRKGVKK